MKFKVNSSLDRYSELTICSYFFLIMDKKNWILEIEFKFVAFTTIRT